MARKHRGTKRKHSKGRSVPMNGAIPGISSSDKMNMVVAPGCGKFSMTEGEVRWRKEHLR